MMMKMMTMNYGGVLETEETRKEGEEGKGKSLIDILDTLDSKAFPPPFSCVHDHHHSSAAYFCLFLVPTPLDNIVIITIIIIV